MKIKQPKIIAIGTGNSGIDIIEHLQLDNPAIQTITIKEVQEDYSDLRSTLTGIDIVFITTGLNDSIGMRIALQIAKLSKETGSLTISVVPRSFYFDNKEKSKQAKIGLVKLEKESDVTVSPNTRLLSKPIRSQSILQTLNDSVIQTINVISNLIASRGLNDISFDVSDLRVVMKNHVAIGAVEYFEKVCAFDAMTSLIDLFFSSENKINTATGIVVSFEMHPNFSLAEINDAMQVVEDLACENTNCIFGTTTDKTLSIDYIKITIIVSFHTEKYTPINNHTML